MPQWIARSHLPHNVLHSPSIFMFIYLYGMCVFHICILPYLCVMQYFHMLYMSKDIAKLAMFESQKEVVCTTYYGIQIKKRKGKA